MKKNRIFSHLKGYKFNILVGPVFKMLEAVFELLVPLVMVDIIDNGINQNLGVNYILLRCGLLVLFALVGYGCSLICQYLASVCAEGFSKKLRDDIFNHILSLDNQTLESISSESLVTRINNDVTVLQNGVSNFIRLITRAPFLVIGATVLSFTINVKLSLIFVVTAPLLFLVIYLILLKTVPLQRKVQKNLDILGQSLAENIRGVRIIRAYNNQGEEGEKLENSANNLKKSAYKVGIFSAILNPITRVIINLAIVVLLYFSGGMVANGEITQGEVVALVNYMLQISIALEVVVTLVILYTKFFASYKRIKEVFSLENSMNYGDLGVQNTIVNTPKTATKNEIKGKNNNKNSHYPIVDIEHIDFNYKNANKFIVDLSLELDYGEFIGIIGATGSGKSTLCKLMNRSLDASSGKILLCGNDIKAYSENVVNEIVSFSAQKAVLFSGTIRENLTFRDKNASDEELYNALQIADAYDFVMKKGGLDAIVQERGSNFSGGERQRLIIARALIGDSKILIFDDSTSALDYQTEAKVINNIKRYKKGTCIILVSLRVNTLSKCDKIIVVDHGKIVGQGTHKELMNDCQPYIELYNSQNSMEVSYE